MRGILVCCLVVVSGVSCSDVVTERPGEDAAKATEASVLGPDTTADARAAARELGERAALEFEDAGYDVLYLEARVLNVLNGGEFDVVRAADMLRSVPFDPLTIPVGPLSAQLGRPVETRVTLMQPNEDGPVITVRALMHPPGVAMETPPSSLEGDPGVAARTVGRLADRSMVEAVAQQLDELELARTPEARIPTYVVFTPRIAVDPAAWVDWLGDLSRFGSAREAIVDAELRYRRPEVEESIRAGLAGLEASGVNCAVERHMSVTNGAVLGCTAEEALRLAEVHGSVLDSIRVGTIRVVPDMQTGDEFRSIRDGIQLKVAVEEGYTGEGATWQSDTDNLRVALIDPQGFYGTDRHPAFFDSAVGGMTCGSVPSGSVPTRVFEQFTCDDNGCTAGSAWGSSPNNHGMRVAGAFAHLLQGQDPCHTTTAAREARSFGAFEAKLTSTTSTTRRTPRHRRSSTPHWMESM